MLVDHMGQGFSYDSFPAYLDEKGERMVGVTTMYDWEKVHIDWRKAKGQAHAKALRYYEKLLRAGMVGADLKVNNKLAKIDKTLLIFALKTRFHKIYGEIQKHEVGDDTLKEFKLAYNLDE